MTEQKNNKKSSMGIGCVLIRIAAVLFCLVVVSTYLMSGLFARYVAKGTGSDSARVAGFDVVVTGEATDLDVICAKTEDTGTYTITVQNNSEVAVDYTLAVDTSVASGSKEFDKAAVTAAFDNNSGSLAVGAAPADHILTFSVNNWSGITEKLSGKSGSVSLNFTVTVDVTQID